MTEERHEEEKRVMGRDEDRLEPRKETNEYQWGQGLSRRIKFKVLN